MWVICSSIFRMYYQDIVDVNLVKALYHCGHSAYTEDGFHLKFGLRWFSHKLVSTLNLDSRKKHLCSTRMIQYDFGYFVANLTRWDFLKWPKIGYFWIRFSVLENHAVTTLRVVESGSPWQYGLRRIETRNQKWLFCSR